MLLHLEITWKLLTSSPALELLDPSSQEQEYAGMSSMLEHPLKQLKLLPVVLQSRSKLESTLMKRNLYMLILLVTTGTRLKMTRPQQLAPDMGSVASI